MRLAAKTTLPAAIAVACLFSCSIAEAKKPDKPGGGGGDTSAPYRVVQLPFEGVPYAISEVSNTGTVTAIIESTEAGYGSAAFRESMRIAEPFWNRVSCPNHRRLTVTMASSRTLAVVHSM